VWSTVWAVVDNRSDGLRGGEDVEYRIAICAQVNDRTTAYALSISLPIEFSSSERDFKRCLAVLRVGSNARLRRKLLIAPEEGRRGERGECTSSLR
jgi:hypothetical protein